MQTPAFQLAQANYSLWKAGIPPEQAQLFIDRLDEVNALAERCPGFVWRYLSGPGDASVTAAFASDRAIFNMSVWASPEHLKAFAFGGRHLHMLRQRALWFDRLPGITSVMWWVPAGYRPSVADARYRFELVERHGPSPRAFTFSRQFAPA